MWILEKGSELCPPAKGLGSAVSSLSGVWGGASRPLERFPLFSAFRMGSPDSITGLILDDRYFLTSALWEEFRPRNR